MLPLKAMTRSEFVRQMGELLCAAKPNLVRCELFTGANVPLTEIEMAMGWQDPANDEIVLVTCDNGYTYKINVTADSLAAIVLDVFKQMMNH